MTRIEAKSRATDLVSKMTVEEMISQLVYTSAPIERLNIHPYNWWNEALHGVARAGTATVFPQAIGMASTFNADIIGKVAAAISTEGRAKYNESVKQENYDIYHGLTYWSPNINIFRDPHWGRGHETYGEDPFLTSVLGVSFVKNLQGNGPYLKAAACAKHFAVHSGPEKKRHFFDANASLKDMWETYLPAFEQLVSKANVESVMGAYNRTNGEVCCAHSYLLKKILRENWNFEGHVVSDCGAIADFHEHHHVTEDAAHSAALALKNGCDLNCGGVYYSLVDAYEQDLVTEDEIRTAAVHLYTTRFLLGEFEENRPYSDIGYEWVGCDEYRKLNLKVAEESIVLLKNDGILPLKSEEIKNIAVVGPNADSRVALLGNYHGTADDYCTVLEGIRKQFPNNRIYFSEGSPLGNNVNVEEDITFMKADVKSLLDEAVAVSGQSAVTILCVGLDETLEGEDGFESSGDKTTLYLPQQQQLLIDTMCDVAENLVIVNLCGSSIDLGSKAYEKARAILQAWYPGARGGEAISRILAGVVSPSGRLPVTFYYGNEKLPDFEDYSMENRTYRYFKNKPLFPFGFGMSYTEFSYSNLNITNNSDRILVSVNVKNTGQTSGREVVQVYAQINDSRFTCPKYQLCAVASAELLSGEVKSVTLEVDRYWLKAVDFDGNRVDPNQTVTIYIGGHQPDDRSRELGCRDCLKEDITNVFAGN